jgi:hypothetical protein
MSGTDRADSGTPIDAHDPVHFSEKAILVALLWWECCSTIGV